MGPPKNQARTALGPLDMRFDDAFVLHAHVYVFIGR